MKKILSSTSLTSLVSAYANANAASKIYICATAQNSTLVQADYELLTWVEIGGVGSRGEMGKNTNILSYNTWGDGVVQKAKGMTDAGTVELEVARSSTDAGQVILRTAAAVGNNNNYAFKELRSDGPVGGVGSVFYNRGLVAGPKRPGGRNEDFDLEVFTLGFQQEEVLVAPSSAGTAPYFTAIPTLSGTFTVGQVITAANGTWAGDATITYQYQWFANNILISGATSGTYTLLAAQLGKRISVRVIATNLSGSASAMTAPSAAVA